MKKLHIGISVINDTQYVARECGNSEVGHLRECRLEKSEVLTFELRTGEREQANSTKPFK